MSDSETWTADRRLTGRGAPTLSTGNPTSIKPSSGKPGPVTKEKNLRSCSCGLFTKFSGRITSAQGNALAIASRAISAEGLRSAEHTSELQSRFDLVCRHLLENNKHQSVTPQPE